MQVIGVGAAVVGDMSSRKDWGIHELDFVFSTLVVGTAVHGRPALLSSALHLPVHPHTLAVLAKQSQLHCFEELNAWAQVGSIMNFALMYLLAKTPSSAATARGGNLVARLFDENTLKGMGAPGTASHSSACLVQAAPDGSAG